tara:strand:- start:213 stop:932 length:720 start_codon:yes stop_codon:yes gene_type:complete
MAYYTGKDVKVWVTTECSDAGIYLNADAKLKVQDNSAHTSPTVANNSQQVYPFDSHLGYAGFNLSDVTGVDVTFGAQDEEISYFGTKTPGKIETKKDMSITITRKKSDKLWSVMQQGTCDTVGDSEGDGKHSARHGVRTASTIADGSTDPKSAVVGSDVVYGYRVAIQLKADSSGSANDGAVIVLRNAMYSEYSSTMSNDTANEETLTFASMVEPLLLSGAKTGNVFTGGTTATTQAEM